MIALFRYEAAILFRSHRWIFPLITYALLLSAGAAGGASSVAGGASPGVPLRVGLDWSAAMLVPVVALLTRSMLAAEPSAARACVAAAAGPVRAQLATLLTAMAGGAVLALAGACYEVFSTKVAAAFAQPEILLAGLGTAVVCLLVGSAVGTLCNRPLLRHPAMALLGTVAAVVFALVSDVSPASAALRGTGAAVPSAAWPAGVPLLAAVVLLAGSWTASALTAARRAG